MTITSHTPSSEIANEIVKVEKALQQAIEAHQTVLDQQHQLSRQILELRISKKDSDILVDKSKSNIRKLQLDIKILESQFWKSKNSGI